jgi:hypothetical protein
MVNEKGSLKDTPAMKLLLTIFEQGLTGILYIKREHILKVLYFSRGKLIWAISNSDVDKLENILAAKNLVPMETINKVKKHGRVSDSIGKLLVEKGLITLEELIESSKEQLRRIINSVFKWKDGGFHFVKESPPERLLSLDLDITRFIIDYIVEEVDVSDIWKEIGSLQVEFIKTPDEQKVTKYRLSDKQKELLNSFDGEKKLETILSRHSTAHRESLLKVIYFYLMAELLLKKEFDLSDLSVFDEDKRIEDVETIAGKDKTIKPAEDSKPMESMEPIEPIEHMEPIDRGKPKPEDTATEQDDAYVLAQESEKSAEETFKDDLEGLDGTTTGDDERAAAPITLLDEAPEEKKRLKFFNIILILIFLILVIGGIILLILPMMENTDQGKNVVEKAGQNNTRDIIKLKEKIPSGKKDTTGPGEIPRKTETDEPGGKTGEKKPGTTVTDQTPPTTSPTPGKTAKAYFLEGSFITAGDVWKRELIKTGVKYGILLELDCLKESVMNAYDKLPSQKEFYILNRTVGGKTCFLVMWGKFHTHEQAAEAIKSTAIPNYFWQQKDPPQVIDLTMYL